MKKWKYFGIIASNIVLVIVLFFIFGNINDQNVSKLFAALVIIYLAISGISMQLATQIGVGFTTNLKIFKVLANTIVPRPGTELELEKLITELDSIADQLNDVAEIRDTKFYISSAFSILIAIAMVLVLFS